MAQSALKKKEKYGCYKHTGQYSPELDHNGRNDGVQINTKYRFFRTEKQILQKQTQEGGGNRYQNISTSHTRKIWKNSWNSGTNSLEAQISHHIMGDVIWALGQKAKHEIMRGQ